MDSDAPPAEWLELFDPQTERVVYANVVSCTAARDPNGEWWELADDETGVPYYYNSTTGATEWDPPPGATIVPFHALLTSSVGKRLSLAVSNRGSVAFCSGTPDPLVRRASRASMRSTDGRVSRKGSLARTTPCSPDPGAGVGLPLPPDADRPQAASLATTVERTQYHSGAEHAWRARPAAVAAAASAGRAQTSPIADAHARLESGARYANPDADAATSSGGGGGARRGGPAQRHSQSETALEALREAMAADDDIGGGDGGGDMAAYADEARDLFDETGVGALPLMRSAGGVPASATAETFRRSEQGTATVGRAGAAGGRPESAVMLHSGRNRSMPSMRGDARAYGMRAFANTQFAAQKRGFLRRRVPLDEMVSYTPDALARPLLNLPRELLRDAARAFGVIQRFMGNAGATAAAAASAEQRFDDVLWLANRGIAAPLLRDEVYCQLAKQVTGNPSPAAAARGWALMGALLYAFAPSALLLPHLDAFAQAAPAPALGRFLRLQLARARRTAARATAMTAPELRLVLTVPTRPPVFGATLDEIMAVPALVGPAGVPLVLEHLTAQITRLGGERTEGLFRVPADADAVAMARLRIEAGILDAPPAGDPNVPASLLKEWLRDLADPLIPDALYDACVAAPAAAAPAAVLARMPPASLRVVEFLLAFLARLLRPAVQARTKMDASNLALVFGPSLLRNPASDLRDAFAATSAEQRFVLALLEHASRRHTPGGASF
ncbi:hypothetical protein H4R18_002905 [Coemansia javaensis]|uniref:Uncharacterized protein n=1 Tax=Coemansia javaensis TaxID=2761396 RepID=A0A9W8HDI6_9FUNG|nr:hypothetical protein H4R18_002905 [Coemansia javaensis]